MPGESAIEWTDASWNPVTGCTKVSPGCAHCYAETFAERWRGIPGHAYEQGFDLRFWPERLDLPLRWRKPRMIFVNSMSDLFHEEIPFTFIDRVFETMRLAERHTFQVLTKRPQRMLAYTLARESRGEPVLPNVWLGTTIENRRYVERADLLRTAPAAVRFISAEPLLGPLIQVDQTNWTGHHRWSDGYVGPDLDLAGIDWLIAGGESGPRCRPMRLEWARALRDECEHAGAAFFLKQLGGHPNKRGKDQAILDDRRYVEMPCPQPAG